MFAGHVGAALIGGRGERRANLGLLALFLPGAGLSRARAGGILVVTLTALAMTVLGATVAPPPPSSAAMAASSLVTVLVVCLLLGRLGRHPTSQSSSPPLP